MEGANSGSDNAKQPTKPRFEFDLNEAPPSPDEPPECDLRWVCGSCGKLASGEMMVCCECGSEFHLDCLGVKERQVEWKCFKCLSKVVSEKPSSSAAAASGGSGGGLGLFDMNAPPPQETGGEGEGFVTGPGLGISTMQDTHAGGFVERTLNVPATPVLNSALVPMQHNSLNTDGGKVMGVALNGRPQGSDCAPNSPNYISSQVYLNGLRDHVSKSGSVLGEGWHVEFVYCNSKIETSPVYCSPDGSKFDTKENVVKYLRSLSNWKSSEVDNINVATFPEKAIHTNKRLTFNEIKKLSRSRGAQSSGIINFNGSHDNNRGVAVDLEPSQNGSCASKKILDDFPVQFEDFFIMSVGKIDPRPSFHTVCEIWPIGYRSIWHDRITGSVFISQVLDRGDSGPLFRVRRLPCAKQSIPNASTVIWRPKVGLNDGTHKVPSDASDISRLAVDEDMNIQMMLNECSPPHLDNVLSCTGMSAGRNHDFQNVSCLTTDKFGSGDIIHDFFVDGSSPSSAWEMVSETLIGACRKVYDETGSFRFGCKHSVDGGDFYSSESFDSLSKFCYYANPMKNIPGFILSATELDASCEVLSKWIRLNRFGLDMGFVQELIEQLPGVTTCSNYQSLSKRIHNSGLQTVGSGVLVSKRKNDFKVEKESDSLIESCRRPNPSGKQLSSKLPQKLIGDVLQACDFSWRFSEVLQLMAPFSLPEIEGELINPWLDDEKSLNKWKRSSCTGALLANSHTLLLKVVIGELLSKVAPHVKPNFDSGETKMRRGKKKDVDNSVTEKKTKLDVLLPMNELTWPELARRYVLAVLPMDTIDSTEMIRESGKVSAEISRELGKVFHCLHGDGGMLCGSLTGVAAMEADAVLLAEASKRIFGSIQSKYDVVSISPKETDLSSSGAVNVVDKEIPEWAQDLEPVRKLATNVGARIRNCIYKALEKNPPEWAVAILKQSITKEVYKGNASGPTKRMVLSVLARVTPEDAKAKPEKKDKVKKLKTLSEIVMRQCRITLRHAVSADKDRVFSNLLGRALGNDDKGVLGYPAMVSRPLDFRTVDIRLSAGVYGESHEAFIEDVREVWHNIRFAYGERNEMFSLIETLSKKFENLYEEEVLALLSKVSKRADPNGKSEESKDNVDNILAYTSERSLPKAPWENGVCKVCGLDKDDDSVLLCDRCDSEYHTYCLDPPLARIPDGNWYCPSCDSSQPVQQDGLCGTRLIRPGKKRRVQREFTQKMLETLAHLADMMELKEYWELTVEERVFLLKYLCDEALSSSVIHDHLDHCASMCAETQTKLRSFTSELKHLKSREDILVTNSAKSRQNTCSGETGDGQLLWRTNESSKNGQPVSKSLEDCPDTNGPQNQLSSLSKCVSEKPCSSSCSQMQVELTAANGVSNSNLQETNHDSQAYQLELSSIKNEISSLRNSIENLESETHKTAIRKEFLGRDAAGRLYWAFGSPGTCQKVIVSKSWMIREGKERDFVDPIEFTSGDQNNLDAKEHSSWTCYETDAEINELLIWLKDDDAREMELKESIVQLRRDKLRDSNNAPNHLQNKVILSSCDRGNDIRSDFPLTKAKTVLEKMFGSCLEYGTREILESQGFGDKITFESRLYRCECLELIRPSRHHCLVCHRTFFTADDLEEHRNGKCKLFSLKILEGPPRQENEGSSKGKRKILEGPTHQKSLDSRKKGKDESKGEMQRNLAPTNNQNVPHCPYNFEEIKAKFVTKNSLKEVVSDIGLIGSGGVPSFLPQTSASYIDPALLVLNPTKKNNANLCGVSTVAENLQQQIQKGETKRVDSGMNESSKAERFKSKAPTGNLQRNKRSVLGIDKFRIICQSSLRPLVGKVTEILRQLKMNLLEMDAALPEEALRPSRTTPEKRFLWRDFVKAAMSIYEMIQAIIVLEDMIKTEYLRNNWWYWSSPAAAAKVSTVSALALRIYALDAAIIYEKKSSSSNVNKAETSARSSNTDKKSSQNSTLKNNPKDRSPPLAVAFNLGSAGSSKLKKGKQSKKKILEGEV